MNLLKRTATTIATTALISGIGLAIAPTDAIASPTSTSTASGVSISDKIQQRPDARKYKKKCSKYKARKVRTACRKAKHQQRPATKPQSQTKTAQMTSPAPAFAAPTNITFVSATCRRNGDIWDVTAHWRVTGGRYTNLGDPTQEPTYNDHVYHGGTRLIDSRMEFHGWPGTAPDGETTSVDFFFQQMIAPIGHARDVTTWRNTERWLRINLTCA